MNKAIIEITPDLRFGLTLYENDKALHCEYTYLQDALELVRRQFDNAVAEHLHPELGAPEPPPDRFIREQAPWERVPEPPE